LWFRTASGPLCPERTGQWRRQRWVDGRGRASPRATMQAFPAWHTRLRPLMLRMTFMTVHSTSRSTPPWVPLQL
jgi:hypothetical protein